MISIENLLKGNISEVKNSRFNQVQAWDISRLSIIHQRDSLKLEWEVVFLDIQKCFQPKLKFQIVIQEVKKRVNHQANFKVSVPLVG